MVFNPSEWDFANTNWRLNTSRYKSSPSSLELTDTNGVLCKDSNAMGINQGKVGTWFITPYSSYIPTINIHFRCDDQPGSFSVNTYGRASNGWTLVVDPGSTPPLAGTFYWRGTSIESRSPLINIANPQVWFYIEVLWWVSGGVLIVRVLLNGSKLYDDFTDNLNRGNMNLGRVGVGGRRFSYGYNPFFDDTSIYKALEE
jgi:hypothetical protein